MRFQFSTFFGTQFVEEILRSFEVALDLLFTAESKYDSETETPSLVMVICGEVGDIESIDWELEIVGDKPSCRGEDEVGLDEVEDNEGDDNEDDIENESLETST